VKRVVKTKAHNRRKPALGDRIGYTVSDFTTRRELVGALAGNESPIFVMG
jgi:hypothetical protein